MTLYFVRHASAGARSGWGNALEDDLQRRLDPIGEAQALALIDFLGTREVTHIYSSAAIRCVQTVEPLAQHLRLNVETHSALMEGQSNTMALHLLRTLANSGTTAVLCSHGDIIPDSIQTLAREGTVIRGPRAWAKGSTWELRTRGADITEAEFLGPY
jgi:phosphohistidine phosphatase SixA